MPRSRFAGMWTIVDRDSVAGRGCTGSDNRVRRVRVGPPGEILGGFSFLSWRGPGGLSSKTRNAGSQEKGRAPPPMRAPKLAVDPSVRQRIGAHLDVDGAWL